MLIRFDAHPPSKPRRTAETSGRNSVAPVISCVSCDCGGMNTAKLPSSQGLVVSLIFIYGDPFVGGTLQYEKCRRGVGIRESNVPEVEKATCRSCTALQLIYR